MNIIPAIDLQNGSCVRLMRGDPSTASVFNHDPAIQAREFEEAGCWRIHVVDLDGAFAGHPANATAVEAIVSAVDAGIQLGGGIRDMDTIDHWVERGVEQVILGTAAVENRELVATSAKRYPGQIIGGIDAKRGYVATRGWVETSPVRALDLAVQLEETGISAIIFTDIDKDGLMSGPNLDAVAEIASSVEIPVIASGGVSSIDDLRQLASLDVRIHGAIIGRAIYDGSVDLRAALAEFSAGTADSSLDRP